MVALLLLLGCEGSGLGGASGEVDGLTVEPAQVNLSAREGAPGVVQFSALAEDARGDLTPLDLVAWESTNLSAGTIDEDGLFTTAETNGGFTTVVASYLGKEGTAEVAVTYEEDIFDGDFDDTLAQAFDAAAPVDDGSLVLTYPPDGVRIPRNLQGLEFFWSEQPAGAVTRLRLQTAITDISVYTDADSWAASSEVLQRASATNRGGQVRVTATSGQWDGQALSDVVEGPSIEMLVNRLDAVGSIFLWSANNSSIERIPFGSGASERFWPPEGEPGSGTCVGCHVLTQASNTMVVTHNGINDIFTVIDIRDVDAPERMYSSSGGDTLTFKDVSPDGEHLVGASVGLLRIWRLSDGVYVGAGDHEGRITQPAFSADGRTLAGVRAVGSWNNDMSFTGGEIVEMPFTTGMLGAPTVLLPHSSTYNFYYPVYSPDGGLMAFNRSTGDSNADLDAELMIMDLDGGDPVVLAAANQGPDLQNSYPRWAPLSDDDVLWLAFSSRRSYPGKNSLVPNVWVTAIDPTQVASGVDPSFPAFWLPGQDPASDNHLAAWWVE